jgi:hypothetical protein
MPPTVNDITEQCPTYLKGYPVEIVGDEALGFLAVRTTYADNLLYVCHFTRDGNGQIQPRWHSWRFDRCSVHGMNMVAGRLMLVTERENGILTIEAVDVSNPHPMLTEVPQDTFGAPVDATVILEGLHVRDDRGANTNGRFVIKNLTIDYARLLSAEVIDDQGETIVTKENDGTTSGGKLRIPVLRKDEGVSLTISWYGFLQSMWLQGSLNNRNRRV